MPDRPLSELEAQVGTTHRTVEELRVEAGKVAEFAGALREDDPIYRDEAAAAERGFDGIPAPPTFVRTAAFPRYRPDGVDDRMGFDLGLREAYLVHGEQAYEYERPLLVGDVLTGETTLVDVSRRTGRRGGEMTFVVYETAYTDERGDLVLTARETVVETDGAIESEGDDTEDGAATDGDGTSIGDGTTGADGDGTTEADGDGTTEADGDGTGADERPRPTAADVAAGDAGPGLEVADVDRRDFVRYAGASGDFTPIHYDEPYATDAGHETVFAQGMLTAGYAARAVTDWVGLAAVTRFETRFEAQLFPGEDVHVTTAVADVTRTDDGAAVVATIEAVTGDGTVVLTGEAEADLPPA